MNSIINILNISSYFLSNFSQAEESNTPNPSESLPTEQLLKTIQQRDEFHRWLDEILERNHNEFERHLHLSIDKIIAIKCDWLNLIETLRMQVDVETGKTWEEELKTTQDRILPNNNLLSVLDSTHMEVKLSLQNLDKVYAALQRRIKNMETRHSSELSDQAGEIQKLTYTLKHTQEVNGRLQCLLEEHVQVVNDEHAIHEQFKEIALEDSRNHQAIALEANIKKQYWENRAKELENTLEKQEQESILLKIKCEEQAKRIALLEMENRTKTKKEEELEGRLNGMEGLEYSVKQFEEGKCIPHFIKNRLSALEKRVDDLSNALDNEQVFHETDNRKIDCLTASIMEKEKEWEALIARNKLSQKIYETEMAKFYDSSDSE